MIEVLTLTGQHIVDRNDRVLTRHFLVRESHVDLDRIYS